MVANCGQGCVTKAGKGYTGYRMTTSLHNENGMELVSHLDELRTRLCYGLLAVAVGLVVGWFLYPPVFAFLSQPVLDAVHARVNGAIIAQEVMQPFFVRMKLAAVIGLVLASPVLVWQLWCFVRPGLTVRERRAITPLMPAVSLLFFLGAAIAYWLLPRAIDFFFSFMPPGVAPYIAFQQAVDLPMKIILAFGIAFQLPVVLLGLVALRVLSPATLLAQWRTAVIAMAILAGVITPTADLLSMLAMLLPLIVLYFGTVLLAYRLTREEGAA